MSISRSHEAPRARKELIVRDFTDVLVRVLGRRPEHIHIVIREMADEDWYFAGVLTDDYRQRQASDGPPATPPDPG